MSVYLYETVAAAACDEAVVLGMPLDGVDEILMRSDVPLAGIRLPHVPNLSIEKNRSIPENEPRKSSAEARKQTVPERCRCRTRRQSSLSRTD
jgi:hypothetical protein